MTDSIIDKIRKLQAKANSTNSQAEAEAFASKVQQLLAQHNLDLADIEDPTPVEFLTEDMGANRTGKHWRATLASAVCKYYMCSMHMSYHKGNSRVFYVTGKAHNRAIAISMYEYLIQTVRRLARNHGKALIKDYKDNQDEWRSMGIDYQKDPPNLKLARGDFDKGCCLGLAQRLLEMHYELTRKAKPNTSSTALIVKTESELAVEAMNKLHPNLSSFKSRGITEKRGSMQAGRYAAKNVSLNSQWGSQKSSGRLLT